MTMVPAAGRASFLDGRPVSGLQIRTMILCGLVGVLDGNDTQAMGIGAPSIAASLHVAPSAMGWAISGSWLGAAAGAVLLGGLADRIGRKAVLVAAVLVFGVFTLLTPLAPDLPVLVACRVLAGIGLGGATPCFIALAAEYAPAHRRGSIVSLVWASFPLGILVGSLMNSLILTQTTWPTIFYVGGAAPLVLAVALAAFLPESISFLLARQAADPRADRIISTIAPSMTHADVQTFLTKVRPGEWQAERAGAKELLQPGRRRATLCVWVLLFASFGTTASMSWVPTILLQNGVSLAAAAVAVSFLGFGALFGMAVAGQFVDRFGPGLAIALPVFLGAAATAAMGIWPGSSQAASVFVTLVGALVGMGASGGIAVVTLLYPTVMRSTGAGWAMGMGRFGQVVIPAAFAVLLHQGWDAQTIFLALGGMPLIAAVAAALLQGALRTTRTEAATAISPSMSNSVAP